ncbi:hypothetical protein [Pantoea stewartii]|uniref:hypothetical protein n=1 Tax=Pantoea stewartii TaxID=66269 RepID=UPI0030B9E22D
MTDADLAKMGSACVKRLADEDGKACAIEKAPVSEVEYAFYRDAAPLLARHGILTPVVKSACHEQRKLILEYIPEPIQQDAVTGDAFLSVLARLHSYRVIPHGRSAHIGGTRQHWKAASICSACLLRRNGSFGQCKSIAMCFLNRIA